MRLSVSLTLLAALLALAALDPAHAQTRTWVSGVGSDDNPCSRTAPCKTFAGAINKTAANGQINVLDPGGYGGLTITKSIAIISDIANGGVLVSGTNGIVINAAATDKVTLRGLSIDGVTGSLAGVKVISAESVNISDCLIRGFGHATSGNGILVAPTSANVKVSVKNCKVVSNKHGIAADPTGAGVATVTVENSVMANNSGHGVRSKGANAKVRISGSSITGNNFGLFINSGGTIISTGTNIVADNGTDGAPTSTVPLQ